MRILETFFICSAVLVAAVSCSDPVEGDSGDKSYKVEFVEQTDTLLIFPSDYAGSYEIKLDTDAPKSAIRISYIDEQTWCSASLNSAGDAIVVTPGKALGEDLKADFMVEAGEGEPLFFTVIRLFSAVEQTIALSVNGELLEGDYPVYEVSGNAGSLSVSVQTSASMWNLKYDYFMETEEWFAVDKASGKSGETCTITFQKNDSGSARAQSFVFAPVVVGSDCSVTLTVSQKAYSTIESVVVKEFDKASMTAGNVVEEGQVVTFSSANNSSTPFTFSVDVTGEGGIDIKFAEPGSADLSYSDWLFAGRKAIENEEWEVVGYYYLLYPQANTGAERSMDVVIVPAGSTVELFRFRVTQQGV